MDKMSPNGNKTYTAGGTIAKGDIVMFSSGKVVKTTAVTSDAIGVALDSAEEGEIVPIGILGNYTGTMQVLAGGVVTVGAEVTATGTATSAATDVVIGRALEAATAKGELIEIAHKVAAVK